MLILTHFVKTEYSGSSDLAYAVCILLMEVNAWMSSDGWSDFY